MYADFLPDLKQIQEIIQSLCSQLTDSHDTIDVRQVAQLGYSINLLPLNDSMQNAVKTESENSINLLPLNDSMQNAVKTESENMVEKGENA